MDAHFALYFRRLNYEKLFNYDKQKCQRRLDNALQKCQQASWHGDFVKA